MMWMFPAVALLASPAFAQEKAARFSFGYAYAEYLEEEQYEVLGYADAESLEDDGGSAPFGIYFSAASTGTIGIDVDVGYHRDEVTSGVLDYTFHSFTGMVGPRFAVTSGNEQPYAHVLAGVRYDTAEDFDNVSAGLAAGGGVDIGIGPGAYVRVAADFQIFFEDGDDLKVLRLTAGISL